MLEKGRHVNGDCFSLHFSVSFLAHSHVCFFSLTNVLHLLLYLLKLTHVGLPRAFRGRLEDPNKCVLLLPILSHCIRIYNFWKLTYCRFLGVYIYFKACTSDSGTLVSERHTRKTLPGAISVTKKPKLGKGRQATALLVATRFWGATISRLCT